jgi:hypothetical protein
MTWIQGESNAKYEGEWRDDEMTGKGVFIKTNGETLLGNFMNGMVIN